MNTVFKAALAAAAGVYDTGGQYDSLANTVIVATANFGYMNHLHNFRCHMKRLHLKALIVALDAKAAHYIQNTINDMPFVYYDFNYTESYNSIHRYAPADAPVLKVHTNTLLSEESAGFGSPAFAVITNRKKHAVFDILLQGYDVLFTDLDVAWLRDPFPLLQNKRVDYFHTINQPCPDCLKWNFYKSEAEGNTGVYFLRSNPRAIRFMAEYLAFYPKFPEIDDQTLFWRLLRNKRFPAVVPLFNCNDNYLEGSLDTYNASNTASGLVSGKDSLVTCPLDGCLFSAGGLRDREYPQLLQTLRKNKQGAVSVHANYFTGGNFAKAKTLQRYGLWAAVRDEIETMPNNNNNNNPHARVNKKGEFKGKCNTNFQPPL